MTLPVLVQPPPKKERQSSSIGERRVRASSGVVVTAAATPRRPIADSRETRRRDYALLIRMGTKQGKPGQAAGAAVRVVAQGRVLPALIGGPLPPSLSPRPSLLSFSFVSYPLSRSEYGTHVGGPWSVLESMYSKGH